VIGPRPIDIATAINRPQVRLSNREPLIPLLGMVYRCEQAVGGRPPRYAPAPLLPPWAPKRLPPPSRRKRSSSRPTRSHIHRCSCLTRQYSVGGEQSGTWPWPLTLKVVSESRVTWATSVPILVLLGLSVLNLGPMYATETDVRRRQTKAWSLAMQSDLASAYI